jgi:type I restriction enzyme S subunit
MNKEIKKGLVPVLRFPEFKDSGEWEKKALNQVCDINPTVKKLPDNFIYIDLESVESGVLLQKKLIQLESAPSRAQRLLKNGDVIFQMVRPYQKNNYFFYSTDNFNYVASTGYAQLRAYQSNSYLFQYLHTDIFVDRVLTKCTGSNYPAINGSALSAIKIEIPKLPEQTKIAACLSSLDDLITAQTQKIEALKTHKKGLMQQLFPQEGETVPKLRFPEFEDEWEWKELNNLASKVNVKNKNFEVKVVLTNSASYGIVRQDSYFDREIVTQGNLTGYYVVDVDDFIYNPRISNNALVGSLKRNNLIKGVMSPLYTVFRFKQGNLSFFEHYFETIFWHGYMKNLANTGARHDRLNISNEDFFNLPLPFPTLPEQQKIADCLSSLDDLINAHVKKCELLKTHKKGLMQGLFPAAGEK